MKEIVTALTTGLNGDVLLSVMGDLVPYIIVIVPVALGVYFLRKLIKGASKAKVKF